MKLKVLAAILLINLSVYFVTPKAIAQENVVETDALVGADNVASDSPRISTVSANYELPFPGMLPDNPFYFLKVIRDGILKLLINDDLKRARFSLESSEKRMFAGMLLVEKAKEDLAITTISKSNNYFIDAINALEKYRKAHPTSTETKPLIIQMDAAILKHLEVMDGINKKIGKTNTKRFREEVKRALNIQKTVKNLLHNQNQ